MLLPPIVEEIYDDVLDCREYKKSVSQNHGKMKDRTNVWEIEVRNSEKMKRHVSEK